MYVSLSLNYGKREFSRKLGNVKRTPTFSKDKELKETTKEMLEANTIYTLLADDDAFNKINTVRKTLIDKENLGAV